MSSPPDASEVARYLAPSERVILVHRRHGIVVAEPVATALGTLILLGWATTVFDNAPNVMNFLVLVWLALLVRALWRLYDWRKDLFVATNARLLNIHGIVTRKVAMMPMTKVTDMSYIRSPMGKVLGWGTFVLESAGQDQALGTIRFVVDPDETYRLITAQIFKPSGPGSGPPSRPAPPRKRTAGRGTAGGSTRGGSQLPDPDDAWWRR